MKPIQLVDLGTQYQRINEEIDQAVLDVVRSTIFIGGPAVASFQKNLENYLDVKHVIPCANGTDALQIALMALGLQPGDEVITASFSYIATAEVIALLRLQPVFIDVEPDTFNMDPEKLAAAITPKTKAIIPVHLYGQAANMASIMAIADKHGIPVVEDTAQAIGARYTFPDGTVKRAGTIGAIGCTSFFPSKNLGCYGDGGAMFTNDDALAATIRKVANHGQSKRYYHDIIGVNSRLDAIQAAVLDVKLNYFDDYIARRVAAADAYDAAFAEHPALTTPYRAPYSEHTFHQYTLKLHGVNRAALQEYLTAQNIPNNIYYPLPIHRQEGFLSYGIDAATLPVTDELCDMVLSLPMHTELSDDQLAHITGSLLAFLERSTVNS